MLQTSIEKTLTERTLAVSLGQYSDAGRKPSNQDFHGAVIPERQALLLKGVALAIADGISSSPVSGIAAETAVKSFLSDYYCTSDAWSAKTAGGKVIAAINSWLNAQNGHIDDRNLAQVTTFSALVVKGRQAHVFHVGDSRVWRVVGDSLEPLTQDHRLVLSGTESYLARALGISDFVDIDYMIADLAPGDVFVMTTDGIHDHIPSRDLVRLIGAAPDLDSAAREIAEAALANGSTDNLTVQILRIDALPPQHSVADLTESDGLRPAPLPSVPSEFDGYRIVREIHASGRSHIFLAVDMENGRRVALKFPSTDLGADEIGLRRFASEEWVARRLASPHVLRALPAHDTRKSLYTVTEYVEGQTLRQWMQDNPESTLEVARGLLRQMALGVEAFHRKDMIHQDLRPENIMIDADGTVKIIDFGAVRVAGLIEAAPDRDTDDILGTHQYAAPECFLGHRGTAASDLFSFGVIAYEMLTGKLPYGDRLARARSARAQAGLRYQWATLLNPDVTDWMDFALRKAVDMAPARRYETASDFVADLCRPASDFRPAAGLPLSERDPVTFWKSVAAVLAVIVLALAARLVANP